MLKYLRDKYPKNKSDYNQVIIFNPKTFTIKIQKKKKLKYFQFVIYTHFILSRIDYLVQ